jgi:hypothetical protein
MSASNNIRRRVDLPAFLAPTGALPPAMPRSRRRKPARRSSRANRRLRQLLLLNSIGTIVFSLGVWAGQTVLLPVPSLPPSGVEASK